MFLRIVIFSVLLFFASSGFAAANTEYAATDKSSAAQYSDDEIIIHKYVGDEMWAFVYNQDGEMIDCYPDPDY